ncbi:MAG TPA: MFS transporter [Gaiellaceae bacterium]|nr:MFS transporter [Gaiellaceae bacterium]
MIRLGPLREREFRLLFAGRTISMLGSAMAPVALAFAVLNTLHGSPSDIGYVLAARQVPVIVLLLVGGALGDRLPRHLVMVGSNLVSAASQAAAAALLLAGNARVWELAALAAVNGASSAFFFPASSGLVPQTVPGPLLQQANAALRLGLNATNIVGTAIGGLVVAAASPGIAIAADAVTYVVAAAALARMSTRAAERVETTSVLRDIRAGWGEFWGRTWLWAIVLQFAVVNALLTGVVNVLGPQVAKRHLHGPAGFSTILAAETAGFVLSGAVMLRWRPRRILRTATFGAFGVVFVELAFARPEALPVVVLAAFTTGWCVEIFGVLWDTTMQQEIPGELLSRLTSYDALGSWVLQPIALALAGAVGAAVGYRSAFLGAAALTAVATAAVLLSRDVRTLERRRV